MSLGALDECQVSPTIFSWTSMLKQIQGYLYFQYWWCFCYLRLSIYIYIVEEEALNCAFASNEVSCVLINQFLWILRQLVGSLGHCVEGWHQGENDRGRKNPRACQNHQVVVFSLLKIEIAKFHLSCASECHHTNFAQVVFQCCAVNIYGLVCPEQIFFGWAPLL